MPAAVGIGGSIAGQRLGERLPGAKLRRSFAVFVAIVAVAILGQNLPALLAGSERRRS